MDSHQSNSTMDVSAPWTRPADQEGESCPPDGSSFQQPISEQEGEDTDSRAEGEDGVGDGGCTGDVIAEMDDVLFIPSSLCPSSGCPGKQPASTLDDVLRCDELRDGLQVELADVTMASDTGDDLWDASDEQEDVSRCQEEDWEGGRREEGKEAEEEQQRDEEVEKDRRSEGGDGVDRGDVPPRCPSISSTASSSEPNRVPEDMVSADVSTEHLDFSLARQQWKKMEEQAKGHPIPKPGLRHQGGFQGTHTSLYPPARSPRLHHREIYLVPRAPPPSSTLSPSSEALGLDDVLSRSLQEEPESAVEREIRLVLQREEQHRQESLHLPRATPRPAASHSSTPSLPRSVYHELTANNVIILEPDCSGSASRNRLLSAATGGLSDLLTSMDAAPSANVIVVETSNLIIRSTSEFCLSSTPVSVETQESTFSSNPFFKLRSLSSQSLVEQEIRAVRRREEEWRRQREEEWRGRREEERRRGRNSYDTVLVSPGSSSTDVLHRCVSSPPSPSRTRTDTPSQSGDHKNMMAQRWEESLRANKKE